MAAVRANIDTPVAQTLATTLTRIIAGDRVEWVWFVAAADCYLVYSTSLDDGGALPAGRFLIPGGVVWPIKLPPGKRPLVAAVSGTAAATFLADRSTP